MSDAPMMAWGGESGGRPVSRGVDEPSESHSRRRRGGARKQSEKERRQEERRARRERRAGKRAALKSREGAGDGGLATNRSGHISHRSRASSRGGSRRDHRGAPTAKLESRGSRRRVHGDTATEDGPRRDGSRRHLDAQLRGSGSAGKLVQSRSRRVVDGSDADSAAAEAARLVTSSMRTTVPETEHIKMAKRARKAPMGPPPDSARVSTARTTRSRGGVNTTGVVPRSDISSDTDSYDPGQDLDRSSTDSEEEERRRQEDAVGFHPRKVKSKPPESLLFNPGVDPEPGKAPAATRTKLKPLERSGYVMDTRERQETQLRIREMDRLISGAARVASEKRLQLGKDAQLSKRGFNATGMSSSDEDASEPVADASSAHSSARRRERRRSSASRPGSQGRRRSTTSRRSSRPGSARHTARSGGGAQLEGDADGAVSQRSGASGSQVGDVVVLGNVTRRTGRSLGRGSAPDSAQSPVGLDRNAMVANRGWKWAKPKPPPKRREKVNVNPGILNQIYLAARKKRAIMKANAFKMLLDDRAKSITIAAGLSPGMLKQMRRLFLDIQYESHAEPFLGLKDQAGKAVLRYTMGHVQNSVITNKALMERLQFKASPFVDLLFSQCIGATDPRAPLRFCDFLVVVLSICTWTKQEALQSCMTAHDRGNSGTLSEEEFIRMITTLHETGGRFNGSFERALQSFNQFYGDDGIDHTALVVIEKHFPQLFEPLFQVQLSMQKNTFGEAEWRMMNARIRRDRRMKRYRETHGGLAPPEERRLGDCWYAVKSQLRSVFCCGAARASVYDADGGDDDGLAALTPGALQKLGDGERRAKKKGDFDRGSTTDDGMSLRSIAQTSTSEAGGPKRRGQDEELANLGRDTGFSTIHEDPDYDVDGQEETKADAGARPQRPRVYHRGGLHGEASRAEDIGSNVFLPPGVRHAHVAPGEEVQHIQPKARLAHAIGGTEREVQLVEEARRRADRWRTEVAAREIGDRYQHAEEAEAADVV